ncbi:hypothetical protein FHG87_001915, partial [Trinorchestia longiramus]
MGSQNYFQAQPYRQSTLRSVYSVGDVEGVIGPPTFLQPPLSDSTPLTQPQSLYGFPSSSSSSNTHGDLAAVAFQFPSSSSKQRQSVPRAGENRNFASNPRRKLSTHLNREIAAPATHLSTVSVKSLQDDNPYASLVPRSLRRKSSETTNNTTTTTTTSSDHVSDPPPSYSPPRKVSSEDSLSRVGHRRNSARRPRSRRESRHKNSGDTDSDHTIRSKKLVSSSDNQHCGCSTDMSQWKVQNGGNHLPSESTRWSQPHPQSQSQQQSQSSQTHVGLPRSYPSSHVPIHRISHSKYPSSPPDPDTGRSHKSSRPDFPREGAPPSSCCAHHCCQHKGTCQSGSKCSCCNHHPNSCS